MSDVIPAIIQHVLVVTKRQLQGSEVINTGLTFSVEINGHGNRWFVDTLIKGVSGSGKDVDVTIRNEYKRFGRRSSTWVTYDPKVTQDGVTNAEVGKTVAEIIDDLLKVEPTVSGDLTKHRKTETHGPRSNSVETRRASVIRV